MASMNPPTSVDDWAHQAKSLHGEETLSYSTLAQALASNPAVKFSSASKVPYAAWLLLKVVWQKHTGPITHTTIFGENEEVWKDPARKRLQKQPWYSAFKERDPNPMKWLHMANWKQSADEIVSRPADLMNVSSGGVSFDADNPFNFSKATSHAHHRPEGKRLADSSRLSPRPTPSSSSSPPAMRAFSPGVSPSRSNEMGLSGGPGTSRSGSFTNADSSPDSGREEENRLVNKFRPDEALINASIISLLQGIWMPTQQRRDGLYKGYVWSVVHRQLTIPEPVSHGSSASNSKRKNILTAKTDGCFRAPHRRHPDDGDVLAIIEVKPYRRDATAHNLRSVRVQEGAEMAAWIALESNKGLLPASLGTYR
ncbi:hypothetical protein B0I35DRAFT_47699 [Stachybotrys elegans]|uniref:Uncharacterized protein n=1 Tax=Stachybotrys elegans TaxID=80388 RepID=A0A8K0T4A9_9HYPO|nr:hypothetical protein B0I35DRAFT_47699 [Stachybotrys elegans]